MSSCCLTAESSNRSSSLCCELSRSSNKRLSPCVKYTYRGTNHSVRHAASQCENFSAGSPGSIGISAEDRCQRAGEIMNLSYRNRGRNTDCDAAPQLNGTISSIPSLLTSPRNLAIAVSNLAFMRLVTDVLTLQPSLRERT